MPTSDVQPFQPFEQRFEADGLDVVSSIDSGKPPRYPILVNVRQIHRGEFRSRPALNALVTAPAAKTPWHTTRRLNDKPSATYSLVAGIGTELYATAAAAASGAPGAIGTAKVTGLSGNPLSLLPFQPQNDVAEWMAYFDANKLGKVNVAGSIHSLGLPQPTRPPDVGLDWSWGMQRNDLELGTNWASWGTMNYSGGVGIAATSANRCNAQAVVQRVYWGDGFDPTGGLSNGWAVIEVLPGPPNGLANIGPGAVLGDGRLVPGPNIMHVEEVHPPSPASTALLQIIFDAGSSGQWAWLVPTAAYNEFAQHAILHAAHGGVDYYGVITRVVKGADNSIAVRVYFETNASSVVAGDSVDVRSTLYVYSPMGTPTGQLSSTCVQYLGLNTASKVYSAQRTGLTLNCSSFPVSNRQVDETNDEMHVSVQASDWNQVDNIKIQVDVDDGTFTKNFLSRTIRQADLLQLQLNTLGPIDTRTVQTRNRILDGSGAPGIIREAVNRIDQSSDPVYNPSPQLPDGVTTVDDPGASSSQGTTGTSQWAEVRFKLSDLFSNRFGADVSKGLQKVVALNFVVTTNANAGAGLNVIFNSWWIGGGSSPDVGSGAPYEYRYRYRCSTTGARSNWSPPGRAYAWPHRCAVAVTVYAGGTYGSPAAPAEADKIDIQRRGGTVPDWVTIASMGMVGGSGTFTDSYDDVYAIGAASDPLALEGSVNDQPFTIQQPAFTDTATTVAGTMVSHTGAYSSFMSGSTSILQPGTGVIVNNITTFIYRVISADQFEVFDNVGSGTSIKVEIPSPFLVGQPLPIAFGPVDGWYFACGDAKNPGRLYVFNQNTLDSAPASYTVDITDPGDPLQTGCSFMGRGYVWSGEAMYVLSIDPSLPDAPVRFERLLSSVGIYSRYTLCVGDAMYWLGKDGIYVSDGGTSHNISVGTLAPLFPTKEVDGADIVDPLDGVTVLMHAPSMTYANALADGNASHQFRLSYGYDKTLWFDYPDAGGVRRSLGMQRASGVGAIFATGVVEQFGWWYDTYANGALFHYSGEGENQRSTLCGGNAATSKLYSMGASVNGDDGTPIACQVRTFGFDANAPHATKLFGDGTLDLDPGNGSVAVKLLFDNWSASVTPTNSPFTGVGGRARKILDIAAGAGRYARNIAIDITWSVTATEAPVLYRWGASVLMRPDDTVQRAPDYTDCGFWGPKEFRGCDIECDSAASNKVLVFEYTKDDGTVGTATVTVNAPEKTIVPVAFTTPFIGYEIRFRPSDSNTWKQYRVVQWHYDELADLTQLISPWESQQSLTYVQGIELFADSNNVAVTVNVQKDFGAVATSFVATHNGRGWKSYSFAAPFLAYLLRLVPQAAIRLIKWRWVLKPEAPLGDTWQAQEVELGDPFGVAQYMEVEYASTTALTLQWYVDGTLLLTDTTTLAATGAVDPASFKKVRVVLPAAKGRLGYPKFTSAAQFRIREKGTGVYRKNFGENAGFAFAPLIGAQHGAGAGV